MKTFVSDISKKEFPIVEKISAKSLRPAMMETIRKEHPQFQDEQCLSLSELNMFREKYVSDFLSKEVGELSDLEDKVLKAFRKHHTLTDKISDRKDSLSFGQRLADNVATFGGSWKFIISFAAFLALWIASNVVFLTSRSFDPYPFILLNLILSCIAALQAPVIMMSQNRQEEKDRDRAKKDYMINLKSELEIRMLHEKIDHLIMHQQHELIEIQKMQIEMMNDIMKKLEKKN